MSGLRRKKQQFNPSPAPLAPPPAYVIPPPAPVAVQAPVEPQRPAAVNPAPVPAGWPEGAYEFPQPGSGNWYVGAAGPFKAPSEYEEWKRRVEERNANIGKEDWKHPGRGTFPVANLSIRDCGYLWYRSHDYTLRKHNGDLFRDVLSGSHDDIARAINMGDTFNPSMGRTAPDNPALVVLVDQAFAAI